jgi:dTDP-4-dehydrorhamnose reductase
MAFAEKINVAATRRLAEAASAKGAWMLYISTDYVFDGKNPPYSEGDIPCPVNCYGRTKLEGENATISTCRESAVLRIPFLYGWRAGLEKSALLTSTLKALDSKSEVEMDDTVVRYPTYTADVAKAAAFLASRRAKGYHAVRYKRPGRGELLRSLVQERRNRREHCSRQWRKGADANFLRKCLG